MNNSFCCPRKQVQVLKDGGFVLPLVLIVSLMLGTGMMAMAMRTWIGVKGGIRQSQSREAREIAEAGTARLLESLNRRYAHLLIVDDDAWDNPPLTSSRCANSSSGKPATTGTIGNGVYTLEAYSFEGTPFYGGKATIRMRGERRKSDNTTAATAIVNQTVEIRPKDCTTSIDEPTTTSGFPGLLGMFVNLGNNDVFGALSGNVLCLQCYTGDDYDSLTREEQEEYIYLKNNGSVAGQIFLGPIDLPPVPTPPDLGFDAPQNINNSITFSGGDNTGPCRTEYEEDGTPKETHCVVSNISMSGAQKIITVDSSMVPVRLYVHGSTMSLAGGAAIRHIPESSNSSRLSIFGNPIDPSDDVPDQDVDIAGAATANKMWIYFPDGTLGIHGGSKGTPECDEFGECTGGDIHGAIWAKTWNGSSSNNAQLVVPPDMGTQLFNNPGPNTPSAFVTTWLLVSRTGAHSSKPTHEAGRHAISKTPTLPQQRMGYELT